MYENFLALKEEKKNRIINSALAVFAKNGYKKATIDEIVILSNISKGLLFHYFGSKKNFYLFLYDYCSKIIIERINKDFDFYETDFFARIQKSMVVKFEVLKAYPHIYDFLLSVYLKDSEVIGEDIKIYNNKLRPSFIFEGIDAGKFKEGININDVFKIIKWCSEGFIKERLDNNQDISLNTLENEFNKILNLLKINFYKEEYLK